MAWLKLVLAAFLSSHGLGYGHQSGNPVCGNVHGGSGVVDIRQDVSRLTMTSPFSIILASHMASVGMQLVRMKINAMIFISVKTAIVAYWM